MSNESQPMLLPSASLPSPGCNLSSSTPSRPPIWSPEGSEAQRYFVGKLSDMYIKLGAYQEEEKYNRLGY